MGAPSIGGSLPDREKSDYAQAFGEATKVAASNDVNLGSGMAEAAKKALQSRDYQLHVQESKATGDKAMTPEEWAKSKQPAKG